jgi:hypothetical protein
LSWERKPGLDTLGINSWPQALEIGIKHPPSRQEFQSSSKDLIENLFLKASPAL